MKYPLRPYQYMAVGEALINFNNYTAPFMLVMATGAGKSLVIAEICHQLNEPVLVLCPSKEILEQDMAKMASYGIKDITAYSASVGQKEIGQYTFATIQSVYKQPELFRKFKYILIDECHLVNPKNLQGMYNKFLDGVGEVRICGLTATPYRLQQKWLIENGERYYTSTLKMINRIHPFFFKKIAFKVETQELINQGYLSPIKYYADRVDTRSLVVNSTGADFTDESVARFWNNDRLRRVAQAIEYSDQHHNRTLVFCSSLRQANNVAELVRARGTDVAIVDGKTPMSERERLVEDFRRGQTRHMLNVGVFTTGFDVPELDCIVLARPTISLALYYQMVGRGVRIAPGKEHLTVYDLASVTRKLGKVEDIRIIKESDGFRDMVMSGVGRADEVALFKFHVKNARF